MSKLPRGRHDAYMFMRDVIKFKVKNVDYQTGISPVGQNKSIQGVICYTADLLHKKLNYTRKSKNKLLMISGVLTFFHSGVHLSCSSLHNTFFQAPQKGS